jgi:hypothetical protein
MARINISLSFQFHPLSLKNNGTSKGHDMQGILTYITKISSATLVMSFLHHTNSRERGNVTDGKIFVFANRPHIV